MAKYNVGDKVKVRSDLAYKHGASDGMIKSAGKVVTISEVDPAAPFIGKMVGDYTIEEDTPKFSGFKYIWSDKMFEGLANDVTEDKEVKPDDQMPKLTTGMFGRTWDDEYFVVVGDNAVFMSGCREDVSWLSTHPGVIAALYNCHCFEDIKDGSAEMIWENPNPCTSYEDYSEDKLDTLIAMMEKLVGSVGNKE